MMITNDWLKPLEAEFSKPYYEQLYHTVDQEYKTQTIYPAAEDIFNAFSFTPLEKVKVVILGQDPYHEPGQAHGLCFSVKPEAAAGMHRVSISSSASAARKVFRLFMGSSPCRHHSTNSRKLSFFQKN